MATTLFITQSDLKNNSIVDGSVDPDKFIQFVKIAQEIHIQNFLGTKLYERLINYVESNGNQNGNQSGQNTDPEKILINEYVKNMTIFWSLVEYTPFASYQITNKAVLRHSSETAENVSKSDVDFLVKKYRDIAQYYTDRFVDFITYNQTIYPEYNTNSEDDRYPSRDSYFGGWQI